MMEGGRGENAMALLGSIENVIALWRTITLFQKRYFVIGNLSVMRHGQFFRALLRYGDP